MSISSSKVISLLDCQHSTLRLILLIAVANIVLTTVQTARAQDCNGNGILDAMDIASGFSSDCDNSTVPDECEVPAQLELFEPSMSFDGIFSPASPAIGDVNGDNLPDLVCSNEESVSVYLNLGNGSFANKIDYPNYDYSYSLTLGDADGDGDIDIVTAMFTGAITVLPNNGDGTFGVYVVYAFGNGYPRGVTLADLNNDNKLDLIVCSQTSAIVVRLNLGNGSFGLENRITVGGSMHDIVVADFDGDGDQDVAGTGRDNDTIAILRNNGNGAFLTPIYFSSGGDGPVNIDAGDVDKDGDIDLAVTLVFEDKISVLFNDGSGSFSNSILYDFGRAPFRLAFGDVDRDNDIDIVVGSATDFFTILKNNGTGTFSDLVEFFVGEDQPGLAVGDASGNGNDDVLILVKGLTLELFVQAGDCNRNGTPDACEIVSGLASDCNNNGMLDECEFASIAGQDCNNNGMPDECDAANGISSDCDGSGMLDICDIASELSEDCNENLVPDICEMPMGTQIFDWGEWVATGYGNVGDVLLEDVNGDGNRDLIFVQLVSDFLSDAVVVMLNDGNGLFTEDRIYNIEDRDAEHLRAGDLNNDGFLDFVVTLPSLSSADDFVDVFLNNGDGTFAPAVRYSVGDRPFDMVLGDLDGDDDVDLITLHPYVPDLLVVLTNNGDGTFGNRTDLEMGGDPRSASLGDLDDDGDLDLVLAMKVIPDRLAIMWNNGDGIFSEPQLFSPDLGGFTTIKLVDLDGDDDLDLATTATPYFGQTVFSVLLNEGGATFSEPVYFAEGTGNGRGPIRVADMNGDGAPDLVSTDFLIHQLFVALNQGDGTFVDIIQFGVDENPKFLALGDADNDGNNDIVVSCRNDERISLFRHISGDCNGNGIPDDCDIDSGFSADCNANGVPDSCDIAVQNDTDCNVDGTPDACDLTAGIEFDCNGNGMLDSCDIAAGLDADCDEDGVLDDCENDADGDTVPDDCDVCEGFNDLEDIDGDGIPNACDPQCGNLAIGDVDGSGFIDAADVPSFAAVLVAPELATIDSFCAADVNQDDVVNAEDIHAMVSLLIE